MEALERDGFCLVPDVLDSMRVNALIAVMEAAAMTRSKRGADTFGARNLLSIPEIASLAQSTEIMRLVQSVLGSGARPVRGIFFDKTKGANWAVAWHQDPTLAVRERRDLPDWTNWSVKGGVIHVQPPISILQRMVTLRIMLDPNDSENAPLRVLRGGHRLGLLSREEIVKLCGTQAEQECCGAAGTVLMLRPLLPHASSPARNPAHRRVIHLEFIANGVVSENLL